MLDTLSPGTIGLHWLLASFAAAALWSITARAAKHAAHRVGSRCYGGTCSR